MDSSPDLSLKLRRGSNDSRDSYYMDFAQGIDSDIEEVTTIASPSMVVSPVTVSTSIPSANLVDENVAEASDAAPIAQTSIDMSSGSELTVSGNVATIVAAPPSPLATPTLTNSSENNDSTDTDDDISPTTPLPMPLLPPIPIQQMMPKIPLVDEG